MPDYLPTLRKDFTVRFSARMNLIIPNIVFLK